MDKKELLEGIKIPPLFITMESYEKLYKEHTISMIKKLVLASNEFKSLMMICFVNDINIDELDSTIERILNEKLKNDDSISNMEIAKDVIDYYMHNIKNAMKLRKDW